MIRRITTSTMALVSITGSLCGATVDFQRQIRPLLSDNCFQCHGPDSDTRMAGLRLDRKESALAVIVPGKAAESRLYQRITAPTAARRMPPERSHKRALRGRNIGRSALR
jgi:hypothetical protein